MLVHEICHAVAGLGHGRKFCERVRKAARDANSAGERKLSELLESEADSYEETHSVTASEVYGIVESCVSGVGGSVSYLRIIQHLSSELGLTQEELEGRYKRLHRVYTQRSEFWRNVSNQKPKP